PGGELFLAYPPPPVKGKRPGKPGKGAPPRPAGPPPPPAPPALAPAGRPPAPCRSPWSCREGSATVGGPGGRERNRPCQETNQYENHSCPDPGVGGHPDLSRVRAAAA